MNSTRLPALCLALALSGAAAAWAEEARKIRDNSFLLEEAYNQEPGVIQHIQAFQYMKDDSWGYAFTEEWPAPRETHQLSVTVPVNHSAGGGAQTGLGDVLLNYRYQLVLKDPIALAPRLSLIVPSGDNQKGFGDDATGLQLNVPFSYELGDKWVTHWNAGATYVPAAKGPAGGRRDKSAVNYGASLIHLVSENFNLMVEAAGNSVEALDGNGLMKREDSFFINPGLRFALNHYSGLQVVPGLGMPIGVGPSQGEYGVFVYLSLEHPAF
ncbi:MAG: transporter [Deltaproteobacteria bacterium]|nr:transporter [Deltaproteobacteria bacterium]